MLKSLFNLNGYTLKIFHSVSSLSLNCATNIPRKPSGLDGVVFAAYLIEPNRAIGIRLGLVIKHNRTHTKFERLIAERSTIKQNRTFNYLDSFNVTGLH